MNEEQSMIQKCFVEIGKRFDSIEKLLERRPYDAEIEYIESTGSQWIDTEFTNGIGSFSCKLGARTVRNSEGGDWQAALGKLGSSNDDQHRILLYNHKTWSYWNFTCTSSTTTTVLRNFPGTLEIPKTSFDTTATELRSFRICNGYAVNGGLPVIVYWFKIWDENDILARDLIPVRKGTTGYLYDKVSNRLFGNVGSGNFILSPDKN